MVETGGANRGLTPSMRKGIKRQIVRYNSNEPVFRNNSRLKETRENRITYEARSRARVADLQHYLGEKWIDYSVVNYYVNDKKSRDGSRGSMSSVVLKCSTCSKAYETKSMGAGSNYLSNKILPKVVFKNVPLDEGDCGLCG